MSNYIDPSYIIPNETIIMGLSGGPDSVFLLDQLIALQKVVSFTIIAAHLNHEWRTTAERDQEFCQSLCNRLGITFVTKKISELKAPVYKNRSQEAQGRYYRKYFLESVMKEHNAQKIFLAHHQDDQLETFFIKLIRGTTAEGLCGLKSVNSPYYRPLLHISKSFILTYLKDNQIAYVEDESNNDTSFLRNALRHKLLPVLTNIDHRFFGNIIKAIDSLQETNDYIESQLNKAYHDVVFDNTLLLKNLFTYPLFLQKRVVLMWLFINKCEFVPSNAFLHEIFRFLSRPVGATHILTNSWKLYKKEHTVRIIPL